MRLRDLLSMYVLFLVGGLKICDVEDGVLQRGRRRRVRSQGVGGEAEGTSQVGNPWEPRIPLKGEQRSPALLLLV
jgi:hypothetical protein